MLQIIKCAAQEKFQILISDDDPVCLCVLFVGDPLSKDPTSVRTDTNHSVTSLSLAGPAEPPHTAEPPLHTDSLDCCECHKLSACLKKTFLLSQSIFVKHIEVKNIMCCIIEP